MEKEVKTQLEILNQQIKELTAVYHQAAAGFGISDGEFWVWYALLVLDGEYSQQDICEMWSLPKQTVNSVVANMNKKGFVFLQAIPGTRNRKLIRLSDAGRDYGKRIVAHIYEAEQRTVSQLSEQERQSCIALLGKYITLLKGEINGEYSPGQGHAK